MNDILTISVIKCIAIQLTELEFANDSDINPDFAIKVMEATATSLQKLSDEDTNQFIQILTEICDTIENPKYRNFVMEIPSAFGLIDGDV